MARTNLHELATRLLEELQASASDGVFEGKLREVSARAGLNSVRSADAVKLLEELGRIEVLQRGRRGRDTMISLRSSEPVTLKDAQSMLGSRATKKTSRLNYEDLGRAVIDRLLELGRDDALRAAQVEVFASEAKQSTERVRELEAALEAAAQRETELRIELRAAEETLQRAEENLRRTMGPSKPSEIPRPVDDDDAQAVLDILRSGRA
ncbi:MAG: hypothetical protein M3290_12625 [Actinomycetota bacterium]|nr:hypothetical protein [Actinomycetota bacterium]